MTAKSSAMVTFCIDYSTVSQYPGCVVVSDAALSCMFHFEIAMMQMLLLNDDVVVVFGRVPQSDPDLQS